MCPAEPSLQCREAFPLEKVQEGEDRWIVLFVSTGSWATSSLTHQVLNSYGPLALELKILGDFRESQSYFCSPEPGPFSPLPGPYRIHVRTVGFLPSLT